VEDEAPLARTPGTLRTLANQQPSIEEDVPVALRTLTTQTSPQPTANGNGAPKPAKNDFMSRLWLIHSDQLTAHYIRTVKAEQDQAELPYDSRRPLYLEDP
jgi:hypothetical protein